MQNNLKIKFKKNKRINLEFQIIDKIIKIYLKSFPSKITIHRDLTLQKTEVLYTNVESLFSKRYRNKILEKLRIIERKRT